MPYKIIKKLRKPIKMSVEERTSGLLKEGKDYKTGSKGEYISLKEDKKPTITERKKLMDKINNKTATEDEINTMNMIEEMDVGFKNGGLVKKGLPRLAKRGWK
jgi:hypothetical protein